MANLRTALSGRVAANRGQTQAGGRRPFGLLDTRTALIIIYTLINLPIALLKIDKSYLGELLQTVGKPKLVGESHSLQIGRASCRERV